MRITTLHDHSTRAGLGRHHNRARTAAAVVAVLLFIFAITVLGPAIAHSAQPAVTELTSAPEMTLPGLEAKASHDIAIEIVAPGREGLNLSARLTDESGLIELPITWAITSSEGQTVFAGDAPGADIAVAPGDYVVDIRYGAVHLASTVTLLETNRLMVSYVLNAGGIRILPRVRDVGLAAAKPESRIFALIGSDKGKLVANSSIPGEVLRVPEGDYRVESRFESGNVQAVADVHVKAGRMSAIEIDHAAGLARLAFVGAPDADVQWQVQDQDGTGILSSAGLTTDMVLRPGTYTARAFIGAETLTATFAIDAGETRDIILGN